MSEITLENRVGIVNLAEHLVPGTISTAAQLLSDRRTETKETLRNELRQNSFVTFNSALYDIEKKDGNRDLKNGEAVVYFGNGSLIFDNYEQVETHMALDRHFWPDEAAVKSFKKAKDTLRFKLSGLRLHGKNENFRYIVVDTKNYDGTLTPAERQVAEWAYGKGDEFKENMKFLADEGIDESWIRILSPENIYQGVSPKSEGRQTNFRREGAIAQTCVLSSHRPNTRRLIFSAEETMRTDVLYKGQVTEAGAIALQRDQSHIVNAAYEVLLNHPVTAVESARLKPEYGKFVQWIGGIIFQKR